MKVYKGNYTSFTVISNEIFKYGLSLKAIGLYAYIINKPDGWEFSIGGTVTQLKDGHDSVRTAIKELEVAGFLVRSRKRKSDGLLGESVWWVYAKPFEKPTQEKPTQEKGRQVNTNKVNTKRERGTHTLRLQPIEQNWIMSEYGITQKALAKVGKKYRNWCDSVGKPLSLAGLKLFLTRERWDIHDYQPEIQAQKQLEGWE